MNIINRTKKLIGQNPMHLVWVVMIAVVSSTALLNLAQGFFWYKKFSVDLLIIGTIDSIIISLIVAPPAIRAGLAGQQKIKDELKAQAITDELTQLKNRRGFFFLADQLLKIAFRNQTGIYLMYIDLDNFKNFNDTLGHAVGDRVLQVFADLLEKNYRESDIIARIGGDEFVILPVGTIADEVAIIKKRFRRVLAEFNEREEFSFKLSASIGIAAYDPKAPCTLDDLLNQADKSMYAEKRSN
ncbi:MAG: GGDEF domain-containing protein [Anaerolineales bacterium]|uniref:GGDEF domain-containing protein n=1 Tax=Candidatus Desulfolinea nitratireducens TaxID=2841698 RepID=A0A8J6NS61_9CHLR|nr:GGDEF domain-containing protein [Candidatus Desulfolinea nitratireducens]MBL6961158.1 GGDEF domain-containing protein [Anaerolineales bacterium]